MKIYTENSVYLITKDRTLTKLSNNESRNRANTKVPKKFQELQVQLDGSIYIVWSIDREAIRGTLTSLVKCIELDGISHSDRTKYASLISGYLE